MESSTPPTEFVDSLRLPGSELLRLHERVSLNHDGIAQTKARSEPRIPFQPKELLGLEAQQPGGTTVRVRVSAFDLSEGGIGILLGGYLHPTSKVTLHLRALDGNWWRVRGSVVWCVHREGRYHAAGVQFAEKLDVRQFVTREEYARSASEHTRAQAVKIQGRILILSDQALEQALLQAALTETGAELVVADTPERAIQALATSPAQAAVVDLNISSASPEQVIGSLRSKGFVGPIIAISSKAENPAKYGVGVDVLVQPYKPSLLVQMLADSIAEFVGVVSGERLRSTLEQSSPFYPSIAKFVKSAQDEAVKLRAAIAAGDLGAVQAICRALLTSAKPFGFIPVADAAQRAILALDASQSVTESALTLRHMCGKIMLMTAEMAPAPAATPAKGAAKAAPAAQGATTAHAPAAHAPATPAAAKAA